MPFRSEAQRGYLWANEPKVAKKWTAKYGSNIVAKAISSARKKKKEKR